MKSPWTISPYFSASSLIAICWLESPGLPSRKTITTDSLGIWVLPQELLTASLLSRLFVADLTNNRREIGEVAQTSWFNKNWNCSRLITVRLEGCKLILFGFGLGFWSEDISTNWFIGSSSPVLSVDFMPNNMTKRGHPARKIKITKGFFTYFREKARIGVFNMPNSYWYNFFPISQQFLTGIYM